MKTTLLPLTGYMVASVCASLLCLNLNANSIINESSGTRSLARFTAGYSDNLLSFDACVVYYDSYATENFDSKLDALKLFNTDPAVVNFYVFGKDNSRLSINAIPFEGKSTNYELKLGVKTSRNGTVVFNIKDISGTYLNESILLTDRVSGITKNLSTDGNYEVYLPTGIYEDRFYLNIISITTGIPETADEEVLKAFSSQGLMRIEMNLPEDEKGVMSIFSISGRPFINQKVNGSSSYEFMPPRNGIYIVAVDYGTARISKKILIQ
jgi:hypothetical protein